MGLVVWAGPEGGWGQQMVGEVARGLSLFGGASLEVRRCKCSVVVLARASFLPNLSIYLHQDPTASSEMRLALDSMERHEKMTFLADRVGWLLLAVLIWCRDLC